MTHFAISGGAFSPANSAVAAAIGPEPTTLDITNTRPFATLDRTRRYTVVLLVSLATGSKNDER